MPRILIVDDEKNIRVTLSDCLEQTGYQVSTAVDGAHALEKVGEEEFDLILLDMKMPGMDGMETLRRLKHIRPDINVVMITAYGSVETAVEAMKLGAVDYLRKPFTPDEIRAQVSAVLSRRNLREEDVKDYPEMLAFAKARITERKFDLARVYLQKAIGAEPLKAEPYNLMGVLLELGGDCLDALKMYRAALSVDPAYGPADQNLKRATQLVHTLEGIDMGEGKEGAPEGA